MTCILINSITIPAHDFQDNEDKTERNKRLHLVQVVIQGVYCFELMLKIMAMGLLHRRNSFLRDGWNILDSIVIILGYDINLNIYSLVDIITNITTLKSLRILKVLQPLRNITTIERLK